MRVNERCDTLRPLCSLRQPPQEIFGNLCLTTDHEAIIKESTGTDAGAGDGECAGSL